MDNRTFNTSKRVTHFMKARAKNLIIAGVSMASLFGIISAGLLIFNPQEANLLTQKFITNISAKADNAQGYSLPPPSSSQSSNAGPDIAFLKSFSKVFSNIAKETRPSLVLIVAEKKSNMAQPDFPESFFFPFLPPQFNGGPGGGGGGGSPFGPNPRRQQPQGHETDAGSGFIVDLKNGYVITNNHVIDGAEKITVTTFDNRKYKAKLVGSAPKVDIAVLKLQEFKPSNEIKQVSLGDSSKVEVGDWVVALGAPFELPQTLTMGVVSALQRTSDTLGISSANSFIQTDAAINPGNSGGPLVNIDGQVIGMNTAIYSKNGTSVGIGFAIPSSTIRLVADSIINNGKLTQAYLGVEMYPLDKFGESALKEMKVDPNTVGGLVMKVMPNSPAAKSGLQPYDIIQSINGVATKSPSDIQRQIMFLKPGSQVKIGILRNGKPQTLSTAVAEVPNSKNSQAKNNDENANSQQSDSLASRFGIALSNKKTPSGKGVSISGVQQGSVAEMAGLQQGDIILKVNHTDVSSTKEVESILSQAQKAKSPMLFLLVERDGVQSAMILQVNS